MRFPYITSDAAILGGKPIIKNTRISVEFILELIASGGSVSQIAESYPHLSVEAIQQAISFAAYNLRNDAFYEMTPAM
ncbi:DUF433 domain-containing protein [Salmonirosea aquatica]|uniref:DUF433 domain-containing protein n=1 Tax=Salmonirosea aquatica TaxID=2654236 RepID=A0A7C9BTY8_9BACT|nr:DUF433 domain-containing protein [Cytophagaceae bacterium SJW1-29]